jgi:pyruvate formate lyase activating enzyme
MTDGAPANREGFWHKLDDERIQCDLCPRLCRLREGQRGLCYVRLNRQGRMSLDTYGRSSGFCIDPIEKKPLHHFLPGSAVLSFGTAGCNLACKFCQNWDISKSRQTDRLMDQASPQAIAEAAHRHGCQSVACTYNDPVIFHEYAVDTARACAERGIAAVAVTAGYVCAEPRAEFYRHMQAANVDLKSFDEGFYRRLTGGHLQPVLETLQHIHRETDCWLEITTLLIPGQNDSEREIRDLCAWVLRELGADVPLHFSAFHPDYRMRDLPPTPPPTLKRARRMALQAGLHHVYTGNISDPEGATTYCPGCGAPLIGRDGYRLTGWALDHNGHCRACGRALSGVFGDRPGNWGNRRQPVRIA